MSIVLIESMAAGDAVRLYVQPRDDATAWRILRRTDQAPVDQDDPAASLIKEATEQTDGSVLRSAVDLAARNGTAHYYAVFYRDAADQWTVRDDRTITPEALYSSYSVDAFTLVLARLRLGFGVEVGRGVFVPRSASGRPAGVEVLSGPPVWDETAWPVVTVQLAEDSSAERFIGDQPNQSRLTDADDVGWLSRYQIIITAWSLNPDERHALKLALSRVLMANLSLFGAAGLLQVDLSLRHGEDLTSYPAPVYQAIASLDCLAPTQLQLSRNQIVEIQVLATAVPGTIVVE